MSDTSRNDSRRSSGQRDPKRQAKPKAGSASTSSKKPSDVGRALRSVYDATLGENIPDDFLDLLGKLR